MRSIKKQRVKTIYTCDIVSNHFSKQNFLGEKQCINNYNGYWTLRPQQRKYPVLFLDPEIPRQNDVIRWEVPKTVATASTRSCLPKRSPNRHVFKNNDKILQTLYEYFELNVNSKCSRIRALLIHTERFKWTCTACVRRRIHVLKQLRDRTTFLYLHKFLLRQEAIFVFINGVERFWSKSRIKTQDLKHRNTSTHMGAHCCDVTCSVVGKGSDVRRRIAGTLLCWSFRHCWRRRRGRREAGVPPTSPSATDRARVSACSQ